MAADEDSPSLLSLARPTHEACRSRCRDVHGAEGCAERALLLCQGLAAPYGAGGQGRDKTVGVGRYVIPCLAAAQQVDGVRAPRPPRRARHACAAAVWSCAYVVGQEVEGASVPGLARIAARAGRKRVRPSEASTNRSVHVRAVARRGVSHASAACARRSCCRRAAYAPPACAPRGGAPPSSSRGPSRPSAEARARTASVASLPRRGRLRGSSSGGWRRVVAVMLSCVRTEVAAGSP